MFKTKIGGTKKVFLMTLGLVPCFSAVPAVAQANLSECIQGLRNQGFTRDKAAEYCISASQSSTQINYQPYSVQQAPSNPQAVSACMNDLLYEKERVCYFMGMRQDPFANVHCEYGNGEWRVERGARTSMSEYSAAQACQNAR